MNEREFDKERLQQNLEKVKQRIAEVAKNSGREQSSIRIVPATKYVAADVCKALVEFGITELGENRIQELEQKVKVMPAFQGWHFFGHLQRNKARKGVKLCKVIQTVDNPRLINKLAIIAEEEGFQDIEFYLEAKTSDEPSKTGAEMNEIPGLIEEAMKYPRLKLTGFMTMAPYGVGEKAQKYFGILRELRDEMQEKFGIDLPELSMGMSEDFEYAVKEGATIIRLGSILYEGIHPE